MRTCAFTAVLLLAPAAAAQEVKVFKALAPEQSEALLKKLGFDYKKVEPKDQPDTFFYDFKNKNVPVRFYHYGGKDVMLDAAFPKMPLEKVNEWNLKAKFTRACLQRDPKAEFVTLESNLDLLGGVTEDTLKQYFRNFEEEMVVFARFQRDPGADDQIVRPVSDEKLEGILRGMNVAFAKSAIKEGGGSIYDFEAAGQRLRLVNFAGKDLWMDAHFKKIPLEDVNKYNLEKKFIRVVSHEGGGQPYTALEANLDCEAGTTEGILRHFILGFQEDAKEFAKYVQGR